jgi:hypothetical protein
MLHVRWRRHDVRLPVGLGASEMVLGLPVDNCGGVDLTLRVGKRTRSLE